MSRASSWLFSKTILALGMLLFGFSLSLSLAQSGAQTPGVRSWMDVKLSPDQRASLVLKEMTLDEKISLLHGTGMSGLSPMSPVGHPLQRRRRLCRGRPAPRNP